MKDLSFESPRAPESLLQGPSEPPQIELNVDINVNRLAENAFEVVLKVFSRANGEQGTLFLVDLLYGGIFELSGIPEDKIDSILFVDCPFILYPFARRVVADATRDGGFPPLMLEPIDFHALYQQNRQNAAADNNAD